MKTHVKKLGKLQRRAGRALAVFTKTQQKLNKHNDELAQTISAIDNDIDQLYALRRAATEHHAVNTTVLGNINRILNGEDAEVSR